MAHFAEIDQNNQVLRVVVVDNSKEDKGQEFLANDLGLGGTWIQTSYNSNFRVRFAIPGGTYDPTNNAFINPKPYSNWVLNSSSLDWEAPIAYPSDHKVYVWNEQEQNWMLIE